MQGRNCDCGPSDILKSEAPWMDTDAFDYANRVIAGSETEAHRAINPRWVSDDDLGREALTGMQRLGYAIGALGVAWGSIGMVVLILLEMRR